MRADRLVAMLMLLQRHGRMSAETLAEELEVSERTIYRDCDALSSAGIPVYAQRGPGGGISLLDSFRTDLTGLTTGEAQALFTLTIPAPIDELGLGAELRSALRKLAAAVPEHRQDGDLRLQERFYIDSSEWTGAASTGRLFKTIRQALWEDLELQVTYYSELGSHAGTISTVLSPYGLVAAAGAWYLVAGSGEHLTVLPLERMIGVELARGSFTRPPDFRLAELWRSWIERGQKERPVFIVKARLSPELLPLLADHILVIEDSRPGDDWRLVTLKFETFEEARMRVLGWGGALEVLEPRALRLSIIDFARQVLETYDE